MVQWHSIRLPMQGRGLTLVQEGPLGRKRQPTAVFWPGKSHGQRSLVGYSPWGPKESDMTEQLSINKKGEDKGDNCQFFSEVIA